MSANALSTNSKQKLHFMYGKWTDFIKCVDIGSYNDYMRENSHKFKRDDKSPNESPAHTPRKLLSKMNSLKMSSFRSLSIQEPEEPDTADGEMPKGETAYALDIPKSITVWEADPRPANTSEVGRTLQHIYTNWYSASGGLMNII